jgi:hypothetical protein
MQTKTVQFKGQTVEVPVKPWYTSTTIWIGAALLLGEIFTYLGDQYDNIPALTTVAGILIIINRFFTKTAVK